VLKDFRTQLKNKFNKLPVSIFLLVIVAIITAGCLIVPALYLGIFKLNLNWYVTGVIVLLPFLTAVFYFLLTPAQNKKFSQIFPGTKLRRFPLLMFYDPEPAKHYRFKPEEDNWWNIIEEGDLLLRRHDSYADGLILRQTGYFTHSAIAKKYDDGSVYVYHAVSAGVQKIPIADFVHCDDVVVLRITKESIKEFLINKPHIDEKFIEENKSVHSHKHFIAENKKEIPVILKADRRKINGRITKDDVRKMIEESGKELKIDHLLRHKELAIYDHLAQYSEKILHEDWRSVITALADAYKNKKIPYDFSFDFTNPDKMSCVEFAWNCYKCMFPVHGVKRTYFTFFNSKKMRPYILAPDLFIKKRVFNAFTPVYISIKGITDHEALIKFCDNKKFKFWKFIFICVVCQIILLLLIDLAQHHFRF
jgi:hypothetical protein